MTDKWNYNGDVNLECGGYYWRQDDPEDDYVYCVGIVGSNAFGGPDNIYLVESGTLYIPESDKDKQACLNTCGYKLIDNMIHDCCGGIFSLDSDHGKILLIDSIKAYYGVESGYGGQEVIQIGKLDSQYDESDYVFNPTIVIHGNNNLRKYIEKEYL
ncbi:MAG: hypothetical protein ACUZ8E_11965 [Candidatus Anammoxibacter sp.]